LNHKAERRPAGPQFGYEVRLVPPWDPSDIGIFSADFMEFALVFITMAVSFIIMVVLGNWWAR
jgi:hypothetical protein